MANIGQKLLQDTMNYLASCPYGEVRELIDEWQKCLGEVKADKTEEIKPEPE